MALGMAFRFGDLSFSPDHHSVSRNGVPVIVGARGLDVLALLLQNPRKVVPAEALTHAAWGTRTVHPNNLAVQMSALRKALGPTRDGRPYIQNIPGRGYMLCADVARAEDNAAPPHRWLAVPGTSFIGRGAEVAALRQLRTAARLITVAGAGGVGKTRLVQHLLATEPGDSWLGVDLAQANDAARALQAIASALGDVDPTLHAIAARLGSTPLLLVLDNAEYAAAELGPVLVQLLAACPRLSALVTSRRLLRCAGEAIFRLSPMAVPPPTTTTVEQLAAHDCIGLFIDRATAAEPGFVFDAANSEAVAGICRRLDGIALAIEMVVPRLRIMSPAEIGASLDQRLDTLHPAGPDVLPRQRSLRTMLDWSWDLLGPAERDVLACIATFRAPATLGNIADVARAPGISAPTSVSDTLFGLVDQSLVAVDSSGLETRYRLLVTTRDYVLARLPAARRLGLRGRHAAVLACLLEQARDEWPAAPTSAWGQRYLPAADDLREALAWTTGEGADAPTAIRLAAASLPLWLEMPGSPLGEMNGWFDRVVPLLNEATPPLHLAWCRIGQSWRASGFGDVENRAITHQAVGAARQAGNSTALGVALMRYGHTLMRPETMREAAAQFQQAELQLRAGPPGKWLCLTLTRRADALVRLQDLDAGLPIYNEAIGLAHALEFRHGRVISISNTAEVLFVLDRRREALDMLQALIARTPPGPHSPAAATLAAHLALDGRTGEAAATAADVAGWALISGVKGPLAWSAEVVALLLARAGRLTAAATLAGFALSVLPAVEIRFGSRRGVHLELDGLLGQRLPASDRAVLAATGAAWTLREAAEVVAISCRSLATGLPGCPVGALPARAWS